MVIKTNRAMLPPLSRHVLQVFFIIAFIAIMATEVYIGSNRYSSDAQVVGQSAALFITASRIAALLAAMMIMLQFALSVRFKILDLTFGFDRLMKFHSIMGPTAAVLAASHPLLLYTPKVYHLGTLRLDLWPQLLGMLALTMLAIIIATTLGRVFLQLKFQTWLGIHQLTFATEAAVAVHSLVLGNNLKSGWPRFTWMTVIAVYAATFIWAKFVKPYKLKQRLFTVTEVTPVNYNTHNLRLEPGSGKVFDYLPGQFAFLKLYRKATLPEEHPFTISSSPGDTNHIDFTIKESGDYTSTIGQTKPKETATIDGPYGRFSYLRLPKYDRLIMIAGGVGITPLLSGLRHMAKTGFSRPVILIWANKTEKDIFFKDELAKIQVSLPKLQVHHVLSNQPDFTGHKGFVNKQLLEKLIPQPLAASQVMLCGPPPMMKIVSAALIQTGFAGRQIHTERFSL